MVTAAATEYKAPPGAIKAQTIDRTARGVQVYLTMITPQIAETWLGHNSHNRVLQNAKVTDLEGVIKRGEWYLNGDAIRWDRDGVLLDGQHRLWAIVGTEIAVPSLVITGLDPESQDTMDKGARRSLKDSLSLRGEANAGNLAAVLNYWWRYESGNVRYGSVKPTTAQAIALLEEHPALRDATLESANFTRKRFKVSQAMMATCVYEFRSIDSDAATDFFHAVATGENLSARDPRLLLRHHLEQNSLGGSTVRASTLMTHALTIKAWNFWRDNKKVDRLSWKSGGMKAEPFPEPH